MEHIQLLHHRIYCQKGYLLVDEGKNGNGNDMK